MTRRFIAASICALASIGSVQSSFGQVIADSVADWDAARTNGVGIIGTDDTPEQGHSDTAGSGLWYYREINTTTFAQTNLVWDEGQDVYDRFDNSAFDIPILGRDWTHPLATDVASNRLWKTFIAPGTQLRVQGTASVPSANSNGVAVAIILNNGVATPSFQGLATPGSPASWDFTFTVPNNGANGNFLNFAVGSNGSDNSDTTNFATTISIVPEPMSAGLLGVAGLGLLARRRRRAR